MSLSWVRLDANIYSHDKVCELLGERDGAKAFTLYVCALGWAGGQGTDGKVPKHMLPMLHGTPKLAQMLVDHRLWEYHADGGGAFAIRNFAERQELTIVTESKRLARAAAARKANCNRWHAKDCQCWRLPVQADALD